MYTTDPIAIEAIKLLRYSVWPIALVLLLLVFHAPIARLIDRLHNIQIERTDKGFKVALAAASLTAAEATRNPGKTIIPFDIATTIDQTLRKLEVSSRALSVLWVDDNPSYNENERAALSILGLQFTLAKSTAEAKTLLSNGQFDLVLSDFSRPSDPEAGYGLLDDLKGKESRIPYIIYSGTANPDEVKAARARGAFGQTNQPRELFGLVVSALQYTGLVTQPPVATDAALNGNARHYR
jgi:CheY-like chemotaxis protein